MKSGRRARFFRPMTGYAGGSRMALFTPTAYVNRVTDVTAKMLRAMGVDTLLLDVDNTLALHGSRHPLSGSVQWRRSMEKQGIKLMIMSNNSEERVAPFAEKYRLPFAARTLKPLPFAYWRALKRLGAFRKNAAAVGDQVFTDILGANLAGLKSVLLVPLEEESGITFRIKRKLEKRIRQRLKEKGGGLL